MKVLKDTVIKNFVNYDVDLEAFLYDAIQYQFDTYKNVIHDLKVDNANIIKHKEQDPNTTMKPTDLSSFTYSFLCDLAEFSKQIFECDCFGDLWETLTDGRWFFGPYKGYEFEDIGEFKDELIKKYGTLSKIVNQYGTFEINHSI